MGEINNCRYFNEVNEKQRQNSEWKRDCQKENERKKSEARDKSRLNTEGDQD